MPRVMTIGALPPAPLLQSPGGLVPFDPRLLDPGDPPGRRFRRPDTRQPTTIVDFTEPARVTPQIWVNLPRPSNKGCGPTSTCLPGPTSLGELGMLGALRVGGLGQLPERPPWLYAVYSVVGMVGAGLGAYHGYKRNRGSLGWALGWGLLGGLFPIIVVPVAFAQGLGRPKGR